MVKMKTLQPKDILKDGETYGVRLKGDISSNSVDRPHAYNATPRSGSNSIFDPQAHSGSVAFASISEMVDFVGAYTQRESGNYYAGKKGFKKYQVYQQVRRYDPATKKYIYVTEEANSRPRYSRRATRCSIPLPTPNRCCSRPLSNRHPIKPLS